MFRWLCWLGLFLLPTITLAQTEAPLRYAAAHEYSAAYTGEALLIYEAGQLVSAGYANGFKAGTAHYLASGSKSFLCALGAAAVSDGLLAWDEPVAQTLPEWQADPQKATVTVRQLLALTSGLLPGRVQAGSNSYQQALQARLIAPPATRFVYGQNSFYVFAEVVKRKLNGEDVLDYLNRRVLQPAGVGTLVLRRDAAGNPDFAGSGALTAQAWAQFGQFLLYQGQGIVAAEALQACFTGSAVNPHYGLGLWLYYDLAPQVEIFTTLINAPQGIVAGSAPPQIIVAAGLHNQRLFVIPSRQMVVVRFGQRNALYRDVELLRRVLAE
jgi:CubicO group peptidase (beta-lactamase class C family)